MKQCNECKYCLIQDTGYSNYTVMGSDAECLLKKNPRMPVDMWYGEEPILKFANECNSFKEGYAVNIDVDHQDGDLENYSDDEEIKELLRHW